MPISTVYNIDCMELMAGCPDGFFDLAIVDPPYGLGEYNAYGGGAGKLRTRALNKGLKEFKQWDKAPDKFYFEQLFRVSKNQIIWGGNYFDLPPTRGFVCWDKVQPWENFSQVEYAWTSFKRPAALFKHDNRTSDKTHPTQKPVALYAWLLQKYAKQGDKILDTHLGSGSSRIAAYKLGFDFYACEINKEYFEAQERRFNEECRGEVERNGRVYKQTSLF